MFGQNAEIVLAHALVVPEVRGILAARYPISESLLANARAGALRRLENIRRTYGLGDASTEVRVGRPADVIADIARADSADLIVVGKHGEGGPFRGYTGRTADALVRASPAPILVANGILLDMPRKILVPVTYSSITPWVIEWARRIHETSKAEVVIIHVVGSAVLSHVLSMSAVTNDAPPSATEIDGIFSEDRDRWAREFVDAGMPADCITSEVVFGEVSGGVLAAAERHQADMIVMGSHAGPLRRILLGSAASAVLREADIPVLVAVEPENSEAANLALAHTTSESALLEPGWEI
jgi:nucleotide-binding universal stress UspA family protein